MSGNPTVTDGTKLFESSRTFGEKGRHQDDGKQRHRYSNREQQLQRHDAFLAEYSVLSSAFAGRRYGGSAPSRRRA
jgi:hypothetical protein